MQIQMKLASESHVPRFRAGVGTWRSRYMIPIRLPWRHRARPSATLHEIQARSEERTCSADAIKSNGAASRGKVRHSDLHRRSSVRSGCFLGLAVGGRGEDFWLNRCRNIFFLPSPKIFILNKLRVVGRAGGG
jgi:hypothetical protein